MEQQLFRLRYFKEPSFTMQPFLLIIPLFSFFFKFNSDQLPQIHISLHDICVPILFSLLVIYYRRDENTKKIFSISEWSFVGLSVLGMLITLQFSEISYPNVVKDLIKLMIFMMGMAVYRHYLADWYNLNWIGGLSIMAAIAIVLIDNPYEGHNWRYLSPFAFYIFFTWLVTCIASCHLESQKLKVFGLTTLTILCVFLLFKRLELLGLITLSLVTFVFERYRLNKSILVLFLFLAFMIVASLVYCYQDVFLQSLGVRLNLWQQAWEVGVKNFPLGLGLGQYQALQLMPAAHLVEGARCTEFQYPHNQFLYWFAELGIVGILLGGVFIKMMGEATKGLSPLWRLVVLVILLTISCTHDSISLRALPIFFALLMIHSRRRLMQAR